MRLITFLMTETLKKWGTTFGKNHGKMPDEKGFHSLCVKHMTGILDEPEAYCARIKDAYMGSTYWRGKKKSKKDVKRDVARHQNYR